MFVIVNEINRLIMSRKPTETPSKKQTGRPPIHGGFSIITRGNVLDRKPHIRAYLTQIREGLIRDFGPREEDLTTAQLAIINHVISKLSVLRLIEEHVQKNGIFRGPDLDPALGKFWLAASNSLRLDLSALGITTRKGEEELSLEKYITAKAVPVSKPNEGHAPAPAEIASPGASNCDLADDPPKDGQE
jgi:hypothetical protein